MRLVDSHCHLPHADFDADREAVIDRALAELAWLVAIGDDVATSRAAAGLVRDRVCATVGMHPHVAKDVTEDALAVIRELASVPGVVAIGEIGLDYHYDFSPRDRQREAFVQQLELAAGLQRPVVMHCRKAEEDFVALLEPVQARLVGGVVHCFGGDAALAARCLAWGFHISFAGNVTFPKAAALRDAARIVPLDRLLVETDSPYLAPQPVRGKRCEPLYVHYTANLLAEIKGVAREALAEVTTANAERLFGKPPFRD